MKEEAGLVQEGLVHIYCGDGKGKTSAALGLALRAAGRAKKVLIVRFLKNEDSGELISLRQVPGIRILPNERNFGFVWKMDEKTKKEAAAWNRLLFERAVREAKDSDLLVLDEIMAAEDFAFYQKYVPGLFFLTGVGSPRYHEPLHSDCFNFDEKNLLNAVEVYRRILGIA